MGATSIVQGSPYFSVDREGYFQWEDRLVAELSPEAVQERADLLFFLQPVQAL